MGEGGLRAGSESLDQGDKQGFEEVWLRKGRVDGSWKEAWD